jgi:hypothetical protein
LVAAQSGWGGARPCCCSKGCQADLEVLQCMASINPEMAEIQS